MYTSTLQLSAEEDCYTISNIHSKAQKTQKNSKLQNFHSGKRILSGPPGIFYRILQS